MIALEHEHLSFGGMGAVTGKEFIDSYFPDWLEEGTESSLRDSEDDAPLVPVLAQISSQSAVPRSMSSRASPVILTPTNGISPSSSLRQDGSKNDWSDLDKFYEDTNGIEESEESEEEEDSEEEVLTEEGEATEGSDEEADESADERIHR